MDYFTSIIEPRWANTNHTIISFKIKLNGSDEFQPAIVGVEDPTECAQNLWVRFNSGEWGVIADWDPEVSNYDSIVITPDPVSRLLEPTIVTFVDGLPE